MKRILFVCTGNTCRSCMAEAIFNSLISSDKELKNHYISFSAGIAAFDDDPASPNSVKVLGEEWEIDLTSHRARKIDSNLINSIDIILTMTREHKKSVVLSYPETFAKVYTLKEFAANLGNNSNNRSDGLKFDITDPYGMPVEAYRQCAKEIAGALEGVIERLKLFLT